MKAIITSIGEPTTKLCFDVLCRNGFDAIIYRDTTTSLAEKLQAIYREIDEDFVRVDADVVPNRNLMPVRMVSPKPVWWVQYLTYDWYKQDITHGGVQFIKREALPVLRANIDRFMAAERPESQMYRLDEFATPRRGITVNMIMGLHGYKQNDITRIKAQKRRRKQYNNYDWELVEQLDLL